MKLKVTRTRIVKYFALYFILCVCLAHICMFFRVLLITVCGVSADFGGGISDVIERIQEQAVAADRKFAARSNHILRKISRHRHDDDEEVNDDDYTGEEVN